MKNVLLAVADIPLKIELKRKEFLPPSFKQFQIDNQIPFRQPWRLESLMIDKIRPSSDSVSLKKRLDRIKERFNPSKQTFYNYVEKEKALLSLPRSYRRNRCPISFYFDDPVEVNIKKNKITHFYLKGRILNGLDGFDHRPISFAYSQILALNEGILLHCACVAKEEKAYLFFAPAGGGKSTVAGLSKKYNVFGDDVIALRKIKNDFFAFATPWKQKGFIRPKFSFNAPLKAVFFLNKANRVHFAPLKPEEALVKTLATAIHFFLYTEKPMVKKILFTAANLFKTVPAYEMYFKKNEDFWPKLEKIIND